MGVAERAREVKAFLFLFLLTSTFFLVFYLYPSFTRFVIAFAFAFAFLAFASLLRYFFIYFFWKFVLASDSGLWFVWKLVKWWWNDWNALNCTHLSGLVWVSVKVKWLIWAFSLWIRFLAAFLLSVSQKVTTHEGPFLPICLRDNSVWTGASLELQSHLWLDIFPSLVFCILPYWRIWSLYMYLYIYILNFYIL